VAQLGLIPGTQPQYADLDLCYQRSPDGSVTPFSDFSYVKVYIVDEQRSYTATGSTVVGVGGAYVVGMCVRNNGMSSTSIDNNDFMHGWVQESN
jgi:hypothetical protein